MAWAGLLRPTRLTKLSHTHRKSVALVTGLYSRPANEWSKFNLMSVVVY
ncbi:hypothetical protein THIAE_01915 [Thiomicrospira aerophila AL3]|uniref:Uncharacterized protein n=1 Tax=Thiomicrospira aerophila AL3 TaxID=717772 RepID=W0DZC5_9GAMM|nr:hypothetical protein THIAE_01915 [Thiomicrospira aerophila AL3]